MDVMEVTTIQELEDRMEDLEVEHDLVLDSQMEENILSGAVQQKEMCDVVIMTNMKRNPLNIPKLLPQAISCL